jgi:hypothetical protein
VALSAICQPPSAKYRENEKKDDKSSIKTISNKNRAFPSSNTRNKDGEVRTARRKKKDHHSNLGRTS